MFEIFSFYFFGALSLAFFAISIFSKNVLYAMSALAAGMIFISGLFFLLGAEFLGVVQIMVYCGAVMVLYGFSIMFFDANKSVKEKIKGKKTIYFLGVLSAILIVLAFAVPINLINSKTPNIEYLENTEMIGRVLFQNYLIVFELAALMLLVAMVCAIILAHKQMGKSLNLEEENL